MSASLPWQRYHALDALRATMMLLGLVLHSAVSYPDRPLGAAWPSHDPHTSSWCDLVVFMIHLFRMPVCFVVAGCFGALLYERDGSRGMAQNRLRRVIAPLAMGWAVLYPLTVAGFVFALGQRATADAPGWAYLTSGARLRQANLIHLWFLDDWLLLDAAAQAIRRPPCADAACTHVAGVGAAAVPTWLLVFGLTGLFVRHGDGPRPWVRYLADASYWMYLVQTCSEHRGSALTTSRVAIWESRQNSRDVYGWLSRPYAEARTFGRAPDRGPAGANAGTLTGNE
jgi:Acyltransferase family